MTFIHIVPALPPDICGVGAYANNLACALLKQKGIRSDFIVIGQSRDARDIKRDFRAVHLGRRDPESFIQAIRKISDGPDGAMAQGPLRLILHYSPYGFQQFGLPFWLVPGLESAKKICAGKISLISFFHELDSVRSEIPPASFLLSKARLGLCRRIARLSDTVVTNNTVFAEALAKMRGSAGADIAVLPVSSNFGEPAVVGTLEKREPSLVVLGREYARKMVYADYADELQRTCNALKIKRVYDIGPPVSLGTIQRRLQAIRFVSLGVLPGEDISALLMRSLAGFIAFNKKEPGQSTVFAAHAAHGLLCIAEGGVAHSSVLEPAMGRHYVTTALLNGLNREKLQAISDAARRWYFDHAAIDHHVEFFSKCLLKAAP